MRFCFNLAVAAILAAAVANAKPNDTEDFDFETIEKAPCIFKLSDFELSPPVEAGIIFGVECMLETYNDTFGLEFDDDFTVNLIIFGDKDRFNDYYKSKYGTDALADGYFSLGDNECVVWKNTDAKQMLNVLFHETNHLLLMHHYPECPMWLNEGLSQYFQGLNVIGSDKRIYLTDDCKQWNSHWLKNGFPVEPAEYVDLDYVMWNKLREKNVVAAYSIGYSMTYFLMEYPRNRQILRQILKESKKPIEEKEEIIVENGKKYLYKKVITKPTTEVIDEIYRGGFEKFEQDWKRWIPRSRQYHPVRVLRSKQSEKQPD